MARKKTLVPVLDELGINPSSLEEIIREFLSGYYRFDITSIDTRRAEALIHTAIDAEELLDILERESDEMIEEPLGLVMIA
jgi:hypothetical protein